MLINKLYFTFTKLIITIKININVTKYTPFNKIIK